MKQILNHKIVVGHSLKHDFDVLNLNKDEYKCEQIDISEFSLYLRDLGGFKQKKKLKDLAAEFLNAECQTGCHSSVIDARVALALYRLNK